MTTDHESPGPEFDCWTCLDLGSVDIFDQGTDARISSQPCPELGNPDRHPPCGRCDACLWTQENGAFDEVTGLPSHPACTGPPPPPMYMCVRQCTVDCQQPSADCPPF